MIFAPITEWRRYLNGPLWEKGFEYVAQLSTDAPDGKTPLQGDDLFVLVGSFDTKPTCESVLETHDKYIDVQIILAGAEGLDVYPRTGLNVSVPHDTTKDIAFYHRPEGEAPAHIVLAPGRFAVFFPDDAHLCQVMVNGASAPAKKAVIKLRADLV